MSQRRLDSEGLGCGDCGVQNRDNAEVTPKKIKIKIKANKALSALLSPSVKVARRHGDDNGDPVASVSLFGSADVAVHREVKTEILPLARL